MGTSSSNLNVSVSDPSGHEYSVKFNSLSFAQGKHRLCYIATLFNQKAVKHNKKVVLKVFKPEYTSKGFDYECVKDLERSITCHELSIKFNKAMEKYQSNNTAMPLSFPAPLRINIKHNQQSLPTNKTVSKVFNNIPITLKNHKYLTVQLYLKNMQTFKYTKMSSNNGWFTSEKKYEFLSAFSHFSWVHTKGKMLINGFQGIQRGNVMFLSDAIVHSNVIGENGSTDLGIVGIINFFANHKCGDCCKDLPLLNTTLLMHYLSENGKLSQDRHTVYVQDLKGFSKDSEIDTAYNQSLSETFAEFETMKAQKECVIGTEAGNVTETIDKMEEIERVIDRRINESEFAENIAQITPEINTENIQNNETVIEEEYVQFEEEREGNININTFDTSDIDSSDDISLLNSDEDIIAVHSMDINSRAMDVSWFGITDNIDNESYAEQKELYDLDGCNGNDCDGNGNDEWEFV